MKKLVLLIMCCFILGCLGCSNHYGATTGTGEIYDQRKGGDVIHPGGIKVGDVGGNVVTAPGSVGGEGLVK